MTDPSADSSAPAASAPGGGALFLADIADTVRRYRARAWIEARLAREIQQLRASAVMLAVGRPERARAAEAASALAEERAARQSPEARRLLADGPRLLRDPAGGDGDGDGDDGGKVGIGPSHSTRSGAEIRRLALPRYEDHGELLAWLLLENVPGAFPYTAGTVACERGTSETRGEDPIRWFAAEGDASRNLGRFTLLTAGVPPKRFTTAFHSSTRHGRDPGLRPEVDGETGDPGVSIATLEDMKRLCAGFDLTDPATSVCLTSGGPVATILAMFLVTAVDQKLADFTARRGRAPGEEEAAALTAWVMHNVRGEVQAEVLQDDPGKDASIFPAEFSLRVMVDIAEFFVARQVRHFRPVAISGCGIAEAAAHPSRQIAIALAKGFSFVEACLARGLHVDAVASNLSFVFGRTTDPERTVRGRVARRLWAVAMRDRYGANERSQKLRRHVPVQEGGPGECENPQQRAFLVDALTEAVEEEVLAEFCAIGGGAGTLFALQTDSLCREVDEGSMHNVGPERAGGSRAPAIDTSGDPPDDALGIARSADPAKQRCLARLADFHARHAAEAPVMLQRLRRTAVENGNVFEMLMDAVRCCSLGQITAALVEAGAQSRRRP